MEAQKQQSLGLKTCARHISILTATLAYHTRLANAHEQRILLTLARTQEKPLSLFRLCGEKSDLFDVLEYISYNIQIMNRDVRAAIVKPKIFAPVKNTDNLDKAIVNFTEKNGVLAYWIFTVAFAYLTAISPLQMVSSQGMKTFIKRGQIAVSFPNTPSRRSLFVQEASPKIPASKSGFGRSSQ